jgi:hypothetical protein
MGGCYGRPAGPRAPADGAGAVEPDGSGPGAAAGPGLTDALHGAPALLAFVAAAVDTMVGDRRSLNLRLVSKACCEAVDAAATRIRLDFRVARQQAGAAGDGAWLARMERRLAKLARLEELACTGPSDAELGQLLAGPVAAGLLRLEVHGCTIERRGPSEPGPSPANLPSLQVRTIGWPTSRLLA